MATLVLDKIVPNADGVKTLQRWIELIESPAWPETSFIKSWLKENGWNDSTDIVAILGPKFGSESRAQRILQYAVVYEMHAAKDKLLDTFRTYIARGGDL